MIRKPLIIWLGLCVMLVVVMVMVGGYTRLSGSGLSMTQWKPIYGFIPPLNEAAWQEEFARYRQIPQYKQINQGMDIQEFKTIFWPEFWHRVLGRILGVAFLLPLIYFSLRRRIPSKSVNQLMGILGLIALQGFLGWYMVSSGLAELTYVSHIRLALHLTMAFLILALLLWVMLGWLRPPPPCPISKQTLRWFQLFTGLLCLQITLGALLAGLHGGLIYNSFPTMDGQWVPDGLPASFAGWLENVALIQFLHRWVAVMTALTAVCWVAFNRHLMRYTTFRIKSILLIFIIFFQFILGVLTLLHQAPLPLALAHQLGGLLLFAVAIILLQRLCSAYASHRLERFRFKSTQRRRDEV